MLQRRKEIAEKLLVWDEIDTLMKNDESKIMEYFCYQLPNENTKKFQFRRSIFSRTFINFSRDLILAPIDAVFRNGCTIQTNDLISETFVENVTGNFNKIDLKTWLQFYVAPYLRAYGTVVTVIDKPPEFYADKENESKNGNLYLSIIDLQNIVDFEIQNGEFIWFAYTKKESSPRLDPLNIKTAEKNVLCILTKDELIMQDTLGNRESIPHSFGFVPVLVESTFLASPNDVFGLSAFTQTRNFIVTANMYLNCAAFELFKHSSAVMAIHEEHIGAINTQVDSDGGVNQKRQNSDDTLVLAGSKDVPFPQYLVKNMEVDKLKDMADYYFACAIENERSLKSVTKNNFGGDIAEQSGFAKLIDREPVVANYISLTHSLQSYVQKLDRVIEHVFGIEDSISIRFDTKYDLRPLEQKFAELKLAQEAGIEDVTETGLRELWKSIVSDMTQDSDTAGIINEEIDNSTFDKLTYPQEIDNATT
jgi:hypothetical protein